MSDVDLPFDAEEVWRAGHSHPRTAMEWAVTDRLRQTRRRATVQHAVAVSAPIAALAVIALATRHAANHTERLLAVASAVGMCIASAAYALIRAAESRALGAASTEFLSAVLRAHRRERHLALFVLVVLLLELMFLVPWWTGGIRIHAGHPLSSVVVGSFWLPLLLLVAAGGWALRLFRRAGREGRRAARLIAEFRDQ